MLVVAALIQSNLLQLGEITVNSIKQARSQSEEGQLLTLLSIS